MIIAYFDYYIYTHTHLDISDHNNGSETECACLPESRCDGVVTIVK